ncbi:rhodanese-like domain-containing protein [Hanstruepera marina]|uniref:rhodanese-like domain-containing protein n=1 Tax=Hanstruepera marina TaxID=2873265 RepID=UPI001CA6993E|nr:rhodanese-like domain-containing protein [Hanstruepera marina]
MSRILILSIAIMSLCFSCKQAEAQSGIQVVTSEEMKELLAIEDIQLVDVRTPEEYEEGYIANFQNIDFMSPTFEEDILKLDKEKPVILYCRSGGRSARCAKKMVEAGFVKIYDLDGGITKWIHNGNDVVRSN